MAATFLPVARNDFIDYDDPDYLTQNFHVQQGLTWENFRWAFASTRETGFWHPLAWISHMLDCQLFGLNPEGHHLMGLLFHTLNAVLVFLVFRTMTGAVWRSWLVAAFFGLHPLRVESVAWAAERKDVLSALFALLTLLAYAKAVTSDKCQATRNGKFPSPVTCHVSCWYWLALLFFALGLMSKPMLVTLPFVLLLLDYWPLKRLAVPDPRPAAGRLVLEKIPFVLAAAAAGSIAFLTQHAANATSVGLPLAARLQNAVVAYGRYLGKLFYPVNLAFFYPHPGYWPAWAVAACGAGLAGSVVAAIAQRRRHPYLPVGWFWFLGMLVPVIGLVQVGGQSLADRFTYLPSIGVLLVLIWGVEELTRPWRQRTVGLTAVAAIALIACIGLTRQQIGYWRNGETLCRHALEVTSNNHVAHFCLGVAFEKQGRPDRAIGEYRAALAAQPGYAAAHNNLGFALSNEGRFDEALAEFQEALKWNAEPAKTHFGMGIVFGREGRGSDAVAQFREAVKGQPDWPEAHYNLGIALEHAGQLEESAAELQSAVMREPNSAEFRFNLGNVLAGLNRPDQAIEQFRKSLQLQPTSVECRVNLANALARTGRLDEAIDQFRQALKERPDLAEIHNNLGLALAMHGQMEDAAAEFREALTLKPDYPDAQRNLDHCLSQKDISRPPGR